MVGTILRRAAKLPMAAKCQLVDFDIRFVRRRTNCRLIKVDIYKKKLKL